MRLNGFQCDGCGVFAKGESGDQRDPGPFLPKDWWGAPQSVSAPCFCPTCKAAIQAGALKANATRTTDPGGNP